MLKVLFVIVCLFLFSCKKNEELYFSKEKKAINIWLGTSTGKPQDSVSYNFAYAVNGRDSVMFNYRLAGYPLDHDTEFELQAVSGDTNLVYYSFGKYMIKAGAYQGVAPIYIDKPANYSAFKNSSGKITFKLKPSAVFGEGTIENTALNLVFRNAIAKPDNWDAAPAGSLPMTRYFGVYSNVKYAFIIQTTGMVDFKILNSTSKEAANGLLNTILAVEAAALQVQCKLALQIRNDQYGVLLDENNNAVVFP